MRRIGLRLTLLVLLLASIALAAVTYRLEIATMILRYGLARAGFPDARFSVERADFGAIHVTGVEARELRASRVEVVFDLARLPAVPIERVRVVGARAEIGASPPSAPRDGRVEAESGAFSVGLLPVLELEDAEATVPSALGPLKVRLDSRVTPDGDRLVMRLDGTVDGAGARAVVRADAQRNADGTGSITVEAPSLAVRQSELRIAAGSATLRFDVETNGFELTTAKGRIDVSLTGVASGGSNFGEVSAAVPMTLGRSEGAWQVGLADAQLRLPSRDLHASAISGRISFGEADVRFVADLVVAASGAIVHLEGHRSDRGEARISVRVPRVEFAPGRLRLGDVWPRLAAADPASGAVEAEARLEWRPKTGISGTAKVVLDGFSFGVGGTRIDGMSGTIELSRLLPPQTRGMQTIRIREIHPGVSFSDVVLRGALEAARRDGGSRLALDVFETRFAGGRVIVDDAVLDPFAPVNELEFRFEEIDVERVFQMTNVAGVTGTGSLSGKMRVEMREGAVAVPEGRLAGRGGILRIRSDSTASLLAGGGESVELLLDALRDFHYDELEMTIEKRFEGDTVVRLRLEGKNPTVLEGHPFRINVNVTGNLDRLVGSLLEIARLSDQAVRATVRAVR